MEHRVNRGCVGRQGRTTTWRETLTASGTASVLTIGWDLALPIFGGVLLGHHLDRSLATRFAYTIGLLVLGLVVGVYNTVRTLQRELRRDQRSSTTRLSSSESELTGVRAQDWTQEPEEENRDYPCRRV